MDGGGAEARLGPREVARVMATQGDEVPWWRVLRSDGTCAPHLERKQLALLSAEGVALRSLRLPANTIVSLIVREHGEPEVPNGDTMLRAGDEIITYVSRSMETRNKPKPTDADIDREMTNICRCGTFQQIRAAIHAAANA